MSPDICVTYRSANFQLAKASSRSKKPLCSNLVIWTIQIIAAL